MGSRPSWQGKHDRSNRKQAGHVVSILKDSEEGQKVGPDNIKFKDVSSVYFKRFHLKKIT